MVDHCLIFQLHHLVVSSVLQKTVSKRPVGLRPRVIAGLLCLGCADRCRRGARCEPSAWCIWPDWMTRGECLGCTAAGMDHVLLLEFPRRRPGTAARSASDLQSDWLSRRRKSH